MTLFFRYSGDLFSYAHHSEAAIQFRNTTSNNITCLLREHHSCRSGQPTSCDLASLALVPGFLGKQLVANSYSVAAEQGARIVYSTPKRNPRELFFFFGRTRGFRQSGGGISQPWAAVRWSPWVHPSSSTFSLHKKPRVVTVVERCIVSAMMIRIILVHLGARVQMPDMNEKIIR